ncbi:MAG: PorT family protein [Bacteroidales bacterium]|nr:PorT family protein [Bacteroidales bacterium]
MKKFFAIAVALIVSVGAYAQIGMFGSVGGAAASGALLGRGTGVVVGVNTSNMSLGELSKLNSSSIAGYRVGLAKNIPIAAGFAIQPEVVACAKGVKLPQNLGDVPAEDILNGSVTGAIKDDFKANITFLEIPVQLQYSLDLLFIKPFVFIEPFAGIAVGGKVDGSKVTFNDIKSRLEYGLSLGGGISLFDRLQLSLRYYWNMEDVQNFKDYASQTGHNISGMFNGNDAKSFDGIAVSLGLFF